MVIHAVFFSLLDEVHDSLVKQSLEEHQWHLQFSLFIISIVLFSFSFIYFLSSYTLYFLTSPHLYSSHCIPGNCSKQNLVSSFISAWFLTFYMYYMRTWIYTGSHLRTRRPILCHQKAGIWTFMLPFISFPSWLYCYSHVFHITILLIYTIQILTNFVSNDGISSLGKPRNICNTFSLRYITWNTCFALGLSLWQSCTSSKWIFQILEEISTNYILVCFSSAGVLSHWLKQSPVKNVMLSLNLILNI